MPGTRGTRPGGQRCPAGATKGHHRRPTERPRRGQGGCEEGTGPVGSPGFGGTWAAKFAGFAPTASSRSRPAGGTYLFNGKPEPTVTVRDSNVRPGFH